MKYAVVYERAADGGIWGYAPDLPGATGIGDSLEEARASVTAGITIWIDEMRKAGSRSPHRRRLETTSSRYLRRNVGIAV